MKEKRMEERMKRKAGAQWKIERQEKEERGKTQDRRGMREIEEWNTAKIGKC